MNRARISRPSSALSSPGNVKSRLLLHVLEESGGGDFITSGGKHFASQNDPEWLTLKAWILGQTGKRR